MPNGFIKTLSGETIEIVDAQSRSDIEQLKDDVAGKLTEPESGVVAGKYFRVASVDDNGNAVLEAVDLPVAVPGGDDGLAKYYQTDYYGITKSSNGCISVKSATNTNIDGRTDTYRPIVPSKLVYAVDSVLCSATASEALTTAQQTSARSRLGAASALDVETISTSYVKADNVSDVETVPEDVHDVRVNGTSIVENGVANIPVNTKNAPSLVTIDNSKGVVIRGDGTVGVGYASNSQIDSKSNIFTPIVPGNLDYAVKSSLSGSTCSVTWTDAEKKSACERIGAEYYPDFTYKGTLATGTQWLELDLTGCTELVLDGVATTSTNVNSLVSIYPKSSGIISLPCSSTKTCKLKYYAKDVRGIMSTMYCRTATSTTAAYMTTAGVSYDYVDLSISNIVKIGFESSYFDKMESYSIAVYAR